MLRAKLERTDPPIVQGSPIRLWCTVNSEPSTLIARTHSCACVYCPSLYVIRERANLLSVMCFCLFSMVNYYYHVDFLDEDEAHPRKQTVHKEGCSELPLEN